MKHRASLIGFALATPLLAMVVCVAVARAQQATPPTSPAPAGEVGQRPGEGASKAAGDKSDPESLPPPPDSSKPTPQRFEPTEKVRPDFDVAFPVDI